MCGILGVLRFDQSVALFDDKEFGRALDLMVHRGPDARRVQRFHDTALLGHVRLSIIDLSPDSHQPFCFADRYWVVFNGEIFNFIELRQELEAQGARFRTHSDTEVLVQAYALWGASCVQRFNGMWAFAIYDAERRSLFCSRDRYGEKPFVYHHDKGRFAFSSEIKSLLALMPALARPNVQAIGSYCLDSVGAQHPKSWFSGVMRLQPGHNLYVENGMVRTERYWHYPQDSNDRISPEDATAEYRRLFTRAVALRMRSDVPFGLTLSSGVDSMAIAHEVAAHSGKTLNCYTARFNKQDYGAADLAFFTSLDGIDEAATVRREAERIGLSANFIDVDYSDLVASMTEAITHLESGNSSPAVVPMLQVMRRARRDVTVILEGQGADELMGGYIVSCFATAVAELLVAGKWAEARRAVAAFKTKYALRPAVMLAIRQMSGSLQVLSHAYKRMLGVGSVLAPLFADGVKPLADDPGLENEGGDGLLNGLLRRQHSGGLVNLLHYGDAISMAASVETRNPFLDPDLVEFVWRLPSRYKVSGAEGKVIHKMAMRGVLPESLLTQVKIGYATPIGRQFTATKSAAVVESPVEVLLSEKCLARGLFTARL